MDENHQKQWKASWASWRFLFYFYFTDESFNRTLKVLFMDRIPVPITWYLLIEWQVRKCSTYFKMRNFSFATRSATLAFLFLRTNKTWENNFQPRTLSGLTWSKGDFFLALNEWEDEMEKKTWRECFQYPFWHDLWVEFEIPGKVGSNGVGSTQYTFSHNGIAMNIKLNQ